jgi:hypothetical protein
MAGSPAYSMLMLPICAAVPVSTTAPALFSGVIFHLLLSDHESSPIP